MVAVDEQFYRVNPQVVKSFLRAHVRAMEYIRQNPEDAIRIGIKFTGMDGATVREAISHIQYHYFAREDDIKEYVTYLLKLGYIKSIIVDGFVREYLDLKMIKDIAH